MVNAFEEVGELDKGERKGWGHNEWNYVLVIDTEANASFFIIAFGEEMASCYLLVSLGECEGLYRGKFHNVYRNLCDLLFTCTLSLLCLLFHHQGNRFESPFSVFIDPSESTISRVLCRPQLSTTILASQTL